MTQKYNEIYQESIKNREGFWKEISNDIFWYKKPTKILNSQNPPFYKWFEDGVTNTCYNALDLHVDQGKGDKIAIIYDSPITGVKNNITKCSIKIYGNPNLRISHKITIKNYFKDHSVFMTSVIAALSFGGDWTIHDKDSINTSFPNFMNIINELQK